MTAVCIPLAGGAHALIDAADEHLVDGHRWHLHTNGYASTRVRIDGRGARIYMHRLILNPAAGVEVDHVNRDKLDNRRDNLRAAPRRLNAVNQGLLPTNTSGYRGVSRSGNRWRAYIVIGGRQHHLGHYPAAEQAAGAYDVAALAAWGLFAVLNLPPAAS